MPSQVDPIELKVHIHGIVIPVWFAVCLALSALLATISFLFSWQILQQVNREIRVLQLQLQDTQAVMIRNDNAQRRDFAPWMGKDSNDNGKQPGKEEN